MARRRLDAAAVADAAAAIADREGLSGVTLARVAADLGVRAPSLYHHVAGRDALVALIAQRTMHELAAALRDAAVGRSGADAVTAALLAYRAYARAHPGGYAAVFAGPPPGDVSAEAAAAELLAVLAAVLRGFGLQDDDMVHAVRALRSSVHGFVTLEAAGGFRMAADVEESFARLVDLLVAGLRRGGGARGV